VRERPAQFDRVSTVRACQLLRLTRSLVYRPWKEKPPVPEALVQKVKDIAAALDYYGYRRALRDVLLSGLSASRGQVTEIMREHGLLQDTTRTGKRTVWDKSLKDAQNLTRDMKPAWTDEVWAADVTEVRAVKRRVFVAAVTDVYSRKVVGLAVSGRNDTELTLSALVSALASRRPGAGLIHHSDRGCNYTSHAYTSILEGAHALKSYSDKGCPTQNAFAESLFSRYKVEEAGRWVYADIAHAARATRRYFETYNTRRLHSSLGLKCPDQFEREMKTSP
jgi:putative transposase